MRGHNRCFYAELKKLFIIIIKYSLLSRALKPMVVSYIITFTILMDDLRFYILFNSISVISRQWANDNERLYAMEPRLWLRLHLERGSNLGPLESTSIQWVKLCSTFSKKTYPCTGYFNSLPTTDGYISQNLLP